MCTYLKTWSISISIIKNPGFFAEMCFLGFSQFFTQSLNKIMSLCEVWVHVNAVYFTWMYFCMLNLIGSFYLCDEQRLQRFQSRHLRLTWQTYLGLNGYVLNPWMFLMLYSSWVRQVDITTSIKYHTIHTDHFFSEELSTLHMLAGTAAYLRENMKMPGGSKWHNFPLAVFTF